MSKIADEVHAKLATGLRAIVNNYPDGEYDEKALIRDVREDVVKLLATLPIKQDTPFEVYLDQDGALTIKFGRFPQLN